MTAARSEMKLASLQDVYQRPGPFVTVYLDTSADAEDASKAIELRWRAVREKLSDQGADQETLQAVADHIGEHQHETGQRGQVLVAQQGEVVLSDELPRPPSEVTDAPYFGPLPQLMPYLWLRGPHIPHVVAVVDHIGADLTVAHATRKAETTTVEGEDHPIHKTKSGGDGEQKSFHDAVEEQWKQNATVIANEISKQAERVHARAIVLAGDVQQRKLVHERLREGLQDSVVETDASHRDRKASGETLRHEVDNTVRAAVEARIAEAVREFEQERGREDRAVEGWDATLAALREGRVRALLWIAEASGRPEELCIGSRGTELASDEAGLRDSGVEPVGTVPADAAVVRALTETSAEFFPVQADQVELAEGVGAILRF